MWLVGISAGVNIVIDPVFILGWGPVPALGTRGAAIATLLSRLLATGAGVWILLRGDWGVKLYVRDLVPDPEILRKLIDIGYPATLDGWARSFAAVFMAGLVARFGPAATAAYGIGVRLMSVSWSVAGAVGQATATGVGQNLGAGTPDRAVAVARVATVGTMALLGVAGGLVWLFPAVAMGVFIDDPATVAEGVVFLRVIALSWAFFGGLMVIQGAFRGAGHTKAALALSLLSRWAVRIPLAAVLAFGAVAVTLGGIAVGPLRIPTVEVGYVGLDWGVVGLWWAYATAAVASFAVGAAWFLRGTWTEGVVDGEGGATVAPEVDADDEGGGESPDVSAETVDD
jgi:putative MATE family efflux protein